MKTPQMTLFEILRPAPASRPPRRTRGGCPLCDGLGEIARSQAQGLRLVLRELQALRAEVAKLRHNETLRPRTPTSPAPAQNVVNLFNLIERSEVVFHERKEWEGSARALEMLLKSESSRLTLREKSRRIASKTWLGRLLREAEAHWGPEVCLYRRTHGSRLWRLRRPSL
jgi:hypothetical protein